MSTISVVVKWSGKKLSVDLDPSESAMVFKAQLFALTGVEPERQKIMIKGGLMKSDTDLSKLNLQEGHTFMMMGTAGEIPKAPEVPIVFLEDLDETSLAKALELPTGLENLGNTCYMNATIQCLRTMPELGQALQNYGGNRGARATDPSSQLTVGLANLFKSLDTAGASYSPDAFVNVLRRVFPRFSQQERGGFAQQDAEECWGEIISSLRTQQSLTASSNEQPAQNFVEQYMTGHIQNTLKCDEASEEAPTITSDSFVKLNCHISLNVNYMSNGIQESMKGQIEKTSPTLDREAVYTKTSQITRLPAYLAVNFVRFYWKASDQVKAKILRKVKFPLDLDMYEFCAPELQEKMRDSRDKMREIEDAKALAERAAKNKKAGDTAAPDTAATAATTTPTESMEVDNSTAPEKVDVKSIVHPELLADIGCSYTGLYELCAVLTHVGRSADSGHYIAWVRRESTDDWFKFDDDTVSVVKSEDVLRLDGGGDWHVAYICLYRTKTL